MNKSSLNTNWISTMNIYKQELATTSKETASGYNQEVETSFTYY